MTVPDTAENRKKCICPGCPSYPSACSGQVPQGCKGEILFCSLGKSRCEIKAAGCVCNGCPVWHSYKLSELYFCDKEEIGEGRIKMRKKGLAEDKDFYQSIANIKTIAETTKSVVASMGSLKKMPFSFDDLHFVPAQVSRIPLNKEEKVNVEVIIGPKSKKPLKVSSPVLISGMSFGAVSKNVRTVISRAAAKLKIGFNSGEGGIMEDELAEAKDFMLAQYATGRFGVTESLLNKSVAVEIRFGQGAYPGKGSFLPAEKMTPEVAKARGLKEGESAYSPAHHPDMTRPEDIKEKVSWLRKIMDGKPVGAKIGCGNVEEDIEVLVNAGVDFIALDGFGGGTGATDLYVRENVGIPLIAALPRAVRFLEKIGTREGITIIAGGGLRTSADCAKCLALGADAVYLGTAALIAINCEQYRICHTGICPTGVTTHLPPLTKQIDAEKGIVRLSNFIKTLTEEISNLARICGKDAVNKLDKSDLVAFKKDLAELADVRWLRGQYK